MLLEFYRNPWIWGTHLLGALVAWFAPLDILDRSDALRAFTRFMGEIFPTVQGYKKASKFPQVSELYFSLMFLLGPIWFWKSLTTLRHTLLDPAARIWTLPRLIRIPLVIVGSGLIFAGIAAASFFINPGYDFHVMPINSSRLALGIWGAIFTLGPWMLLAAYVESLQRAFVNN